MITPGWVQMMARYAHWQNSAQITAAGTLSQDARSAERGV